MTQDIEKKAVFEKIAYQEGSTFFIQADHPELSRLLKEAQQLSSVSKVFLYSAEAKLESRPTRPINLRELFGYDLIEGEFQIVQQCPALSSPK